LGGRGRTPATSVDTAQGIARAQAQVKRDLAKYRAFLPLRCEQKECRPVGSS